MVKKELHKVYLLCLQILILIKVLLLKAYKDKNYLISQSLPTKQRSKFQIFYRKRDTGDIYWCFSVWCFYYELISSSLSYWLVDLQNSGHEGRQFHRVFCLLGQRTRDYWGKLKGPHKNIIVRFKYISCNVYIGPRCHTEVWLSSKSSDLVINTLDNTMPLKTLGQMVTLNIHSLCIMNERKYCSLGTFEK